MSRDSNPDRMVVPESMLLTTVLCFLIIYGHVIVRPVDTL